MIFIFLSFFIMLLALAQKSFAHCPLCVVATGSIVATTRVMGVDDAITGTFVGAFIISTALWSDKILSKKFKINVPFQPYLLSFAFIALTFLSFFAFVPAVAESEFVKIMGIERFSFGLVAGSIIILLSFEAHNLLRRNNGNRNHIPFQGIALPIIVLVLFDALMYATGIFG